jgi:hypothetical protein
MALLTQREAAQHLRLSERTLERMRVVQVVFDISIFIHPPRF